MRATEALSIRICDISLNTDPAKIFVRGEYTKNKADRYVLLTTELKIQIERYIIYKYRTRRTSYFDHERKKIISKYRTPIKKDTDLLFEVT